MRKAVELFWMCVRVLTGVFLVLLVTMGFFQEQLIFHPVKTAPEFEYSFPVPFAEKFLTIDGDRIHSLLFTIPSAKGLILYFHGNAGSLEDWGHVGAEIAQAIGWNVWILDYPGFGKSEGKIRSELRLHELARAFYSEARKEFPDQPVVIYGRSVGSGLAVPLAATQQGVHALILESPFWSLQAMAQLVYPWAPTYFLRYKFRSHESFAAIKAPILVVHGTRDEVIPVSQGEDLAKLNPNAKFVSIADGHHNDLDAFDGYWSALKAFLQ